MALNVGKSSNQGMHSLLEGAAVQRRVIGALMLRELHTRYGRDNIGYVWMLGEPLMLAFAITMLHTASGLSAHSAGGIHPAAFAAVGYSMFMLIRGIFNRADGAIASNAPLLHHRQVTIFDIIAARGLLEFVSVAVTFVLMVCLCMAFGWMGPPERPEYVMLAFVLLFGFSFGVGMGICAVIEISKLAERLVHPMTYLLMPVSGAFFAISWLTPKWQQAVYWVPFPHYFEMMRYGLFPSATDAYFSVQYASIAGLIALLCGAGALKVVAHHIHVN